MAKATIVDKEIGARIKAHRKLRKKNRPWLGAEIGYSYQQIQNYEEGNYRVAASILLAISKALKFPIVNFFPEEKKLEEHND